MRLLLSRVGRGAIVACVLNAPAYADGDHSIKALSALFQDGALAAPIREVDCTLSGGTKSTCMSITLKKSPSTLTPGPYCPGHVEDGSDKSGIWLDGGRVYDADGAFLSNLAEFYDDPFWNLTDPQSGKVNVTDTKSSCRAAARPDVDPQYFNHCVECETAYLEPGDTMTYVIPLHPAMKSRPDPRIGRGGAGITFTGVRLDGPAPVDAILGAHTIAPFDDCGGHVNLHAGYHMHAVTDCMREIPSADPSHAPAIGIAMDGLRIHAEHNPDGSTATDLDRCGGHATETLPYHYHAADPGKNAILGCHVAETGCALEDSSETCNARGSIWQRLFGGRR